MSRCVPIILLASERSGTNLLRVMVSSHSQVSSPPPAGIVAGLADKVFQYLCPLKEIHEIELIDDAVALTKAHFKPWEIDIDTQAVLKGLDSISFWEIFRALNDVYAKEEGSACWISKDPNLFNYIYEIKMHMPDAKFVYMVRDGRDVAASMLEGGVHTSHIYQAAHIWSQNQRVCLNALSDPILSNSMFLVKYEDLITDAKIVMQGIMRFIDLDYEASQLEYYKNKEVINVSNMTDFWKNISKPLNPTNMGKYKNSLSDRQIEIFESIAWDEMCALNYPLENTIRKKFSVFDKLCFSVSGFALQKLKRFNRSGENKRQKERADRFSSIVNRTFLN